MRGLPQKVESDPTFPLFRHAGYQSGGEESQLAALTLGVRRPIEVLGVTFDRIGLGYRWGSNGLRGARLVGSFPF